MLYDRWLQVVRSFRTEIAVRDASTGLQWTFAQLAEAGEKAVPDAGPVAFPVGASADFIISVLQAWRTDRVVCPLEGGQGRPGPTNNLPAGIVHLKMTSATTGNPRLIAFTAEQFMADAQNIIST